jgi:phage FluMu protein Com
MHAHRLECLRCGKLWTVAASGARGVHESECPRCGYLGWAETTELTETTRRLLRERPPELRSHRYAA